MIIRGARREREEHASVRRKEDETSKKWKCKGERWRKTKTRRKSGRNGRGEEENAMPLRKGNGVCGCERRKRRLGEEREEETVERRGGK